MKELLEQLAEIAPEFCRRDKIKDFVIGGATFFFSIDGEFRCELRRDRQRFFVSKVDALALLRVRIEQEYERRGWDLECGSIKIGQGDIAAEAMLKAFIQAVKGQ